MSRGKRKFCLCSFIRFVCVQENYENAYDFRFEPQGSEGDPWKVGTRGHEAEVTAWTNGVGGLIVEGAGVIGSMPWAEFAAGISKLDKAKGVTGLSDIVKTLPDLTTVNGLMLDELVVVGMVGAAKVGFSTIAVEDGTATLSVVVSKAESLDEPEWKPVSTNDIPVKADTQAGFFIIAPAAPKANVQH